MMKIEVVCRHQAWLARCKQFAIFAKRATIMYGTRTRLSLMQNWFRKIRHAVGIARIPPADRIMTGPCIPLELD